MSSGRADSLSVLIVDEEPEILSFFARVLDANGMRALLARNAKEAVGIANRGYVPIDLVLADVYLKSDAKTPGPATGSEVVESVRQLRPDVRALYMSAKLESDVIRIEIMDKGVTTTSKNRDDSGLISSIREAAVAPLVYRMGSSGYHQ